MTKQDAVRRLQFIAQLRKLDSRAAMCGKTAYDADCLHRINTSLRTLATHQVNGNGWIGNKRCPGGWSHADTHKHDELWNKKMGQVMAIFSAYGVWAVTEQTDPRGYSMFEARQVGTSLVLKIDW
jgi:hypothetical protein